MLKIRICLHEILEHSLSGSKPAQCPASPSKRELTSFFASALMAINTLCSTSALDGSPSPCALPPAPPSPSIYSSSIFVSVVTTSKSTGDSAPCSTRFASALVCSTDSRTRQSHRRTGAGRDSAGDRKISQKRLIEDIFVCFYNKNNYSRTLRFCFVYETHALSLTPAYETHALSLTPADPRAS